MGSEKWRKKAFEKGNHPVIKDKDAGKKLLIKIRFNMLLEKSPNVNRFLKKRRRNIMILVQNC